MKTRIILFTLLSCVLVTTSLLNAQKDAKTNIRGLFIAMDAGQVDQFGKYCATDFQMYHPFLTEPVPVDVFKGIIQGQKTAFPDMLHEITDILVEKDKASARGIFKGTNTGSMQGNPPTGNKVILPFIVNYDLDNNGKIKNQYVEFNVASFNAQLMKGLPPMGDPIETTNKQFASNIMSELNARNLDKVINNYASDARFHGWAPQAIDVNGYHNTMSGLLNAFPDSKFQVLDIIADGDKVVIRHQLEGTHSGAAFQGIPVTNKKVYVPATVTFRIANGKVAEAWLNADFLGMITQLNADTAMKK